MKGEKIDLSITFSRLLLLSIPVIILACSSISIPYIIHYGSHQFFNELHLFINLKNYLPILIAGVFVHEFIHAISWSLLGRIPLSSIKYGMSKNFTPFAHCKIPIRAITYKIGTLMPGIIMGFIPGIFGNVIGSGWWVMFGNLFIILAGGDLVIAGVLWKVKNKQLVEDHPSKPGCFVLGE